MYTIKNIPHTVSEGAQHSIWKIHNFRRFQEDVYYVQQTEK